MEIFVIFGFFIFLLLNGIMHLHNFKRISFLEKAVRDIAEHNVRVSEILKKMTFENVKFYDK